MKKLSYFLAFAFCISTMYAAGGFNDNVKSVDVTLSTKIICPFMIENIQADPNNPNDAHLPPVIAGQTRVLSNTEGGMYIFKVTKEKGYDIVFNFAGPADNKVNGVKVFGNWYWTYNLPGSIASQAWNALTQGWVWGPSSNSETGDPINPDNSMHVYAFLDINSVQADAGIASGLRVFTINAWGNYVGL